MKKTIFLRLPAGILCVVSALVMFASCGTFANKVMVHSPFSSNSISFSVSTFDVAYYQNNAYARFKSKQTFSEIEAEVRAALPKKIVCTNIGNALLMEQPVLNPQSGAAMTDSYLLLPWKKLKKIYNSASIHVPTTPVKIGFEVGTMLATITDDTTAPVSFVFPLYMLNDENYYSGDLSLPLDTPIPAKADLDAFWQFYQAFGRYHLSRIENTLILSGYSAVADGMDKSKLPAFPRRIKITANGEAQAGTVTISFAE
jgi:hypothetical protein